MTENNGRMKPFQVRVLKDNADNSGLRRGQIVTVVGKAVEAATNRPYFAAIGVGLGDLVYPIRLYTDSVEFVDVPHPDAGFTDAEVHAEFEDMIDLDPALRRYQGKSREDVTKMLDAAVPTATPKPEEPALPPSAPISGVGLMEAPRPDEEDDEDEPEVTMALGIEDQDGTTAVFGIVEQVCPEHGPETWVRVQTTDGVPVDILLDHLPAIVELFNEAVRRHYSKSHKDEDGAGGN